MPKTVRRHLLVDPGPLRQSFDHAVGAVAVHAAALDSEEDRTHRQLADVQIQRPAGSGRYRDGDVLAAFADDRQYSVTAFG